MSSSPYAYRKESFWLRAGLWVLAVVLMMLAVTYPRHTRPPYPRKGVIEAQGQSYAYGLIRSDWSAARTA
ncbi:hypothetical protein H8E52_11605, partial [bacterium]|nr:hypothetical protein [bacterium]